MEATIFVLSSIATNLAGIYWHVPFTVVDPQHTFLERLVGSVQVSSTIYTLRYWRPIVFPEAAKCGSPAQNASMELGDILKNAMDHDQPPPLTTIHHTLFGRTFDIPLDQNTADLYWTVFFTALVLIAIILVLWKGFTQGSRKHDTDATSAQNSDISADLPSEKGALNWIRSARFAAALGIKDDISHEKPESDDEDLAAEHGAHNTGTELVDEWPSWKEAQAAGFQINEQVQKFYDQRRASAQSELISPRTLKPASQAISVPRQSPVAGWGDEAAKHDKADTAESRAEHNQQVEKGHESAALGTSAQPKTSGGTQSPHTPGSVKGKSSGKHIPKALRLKPETSTPARHEKSQSPGPASAQSPSKSSTESASAGMSKSMWAPSTPTQAQPKTSEGTLSPKTPGSAEGKSSGKHTPRMPHLKPEPSTSSAKREKSKGAGAASAQSPSKPNTESTSAETNKSMWAASTSTQAEPKTPTHAGVEGSQPASPPSAQAPSKLGASASAEMSKSMSAKSTPAQAQPKTPTRAEVEASQPSAQGPPKLAAPGSAKMSKSRWADEPPTAQRSKSVSLPSNRNNPGDLGDTF